MTLPVVILFMDILQLMATTVDLPTIQESADTTFDFPDSDIPLTWTLDRGSGKLVYRGNVVETTRVGGLVVKMKITFRTLRFPFPPDDVMDGWLQELSDGETSATAETSEESTRISPRIRYLYEPRPGGACTRTGPRKRVRFEGVDVGASTSRTAVDSPISSEKPASTPEYTPSSPVIRPQSSSQPRTPACRCGDAACLSAGWIDEDVSRVADASPTIPVIDLTGDDNNDEDVQIEEEDPTEGEGSES